MSILRGQLLVVALLAVMGLAWSLDAPLLMWSGQNFFAGKNLKIQNTVPSNQVASILSKIASAEVDNLSPALASSFVQGRGTPEVLVLYLEPKLRTDQVSSNVESLARLRKEMSSSKTSVAIPFVTYESGESEVSSALSGFVKSLPKTSNIIYVGTQRTNLVSTLTEKRLTVLSRENLKTENTIFSNGVLDILIVELTEDDNSLSAKLNKDDMVIGQIQEIVEDATGGKYVALFAALAVAEPAIQIEFGASTEHMRVMLGRENSDLDDAVPTPSNTTEPTNGTTPTAPIIQNPPPWGDYFPYWFWQGLIWVLFFIFLVLVAIGSLFSLQTPTTFLAEKKKND